MRHTPTENSQESPTPHPHTPPYPPPPPPPPPPPFLPPQAFAFLSSHRQEIKCKFPQPETTNLMLYKRTKRNSTEKVVHRLMQANLCCPPGSPENSTFPFTFSSPSLRFVPYFSNFQSICGNMQYYTNIRYYESKQIVYGNAKAFFNCFSFF